MWCSQCFENLSRIVNGDWWMCTNPACQARGDLKHYPASKRENKRERLENLIGRAEAAYWETLEDGSRVCASRAGFGAANMAKILRSISAEHLALWEEADFAFLEAQIAYAEAVKRREILEGVDGFPHGMGES